jgi:hypothetical protein
LLPFGPAVPTRLGTSLELVGTTLIAGADGRNNDGAPGAFLYERDLGGAGTWGALASLGECMYGVSVAFSGDTAAIGFPNFSLGSNIPENLAFNDHTGLLYSVDWGRLISIDPATGVPETIGHVCEDIVGLAYDPVRDLLFGSTDFSDLYSLDPATADLTWIGTLSPSGIGGLAFDPVIDRLYGTTTGTDELLRINPNNGNATVIGKIGTQERVRGLSFNVVTGKLYGIDTKTQVLLEIDTANGNPTVIGPVGVPFVRGLAIDAATSPDPYGVDRDSKMVRIDVASGSGSVYATVTKLAYQVGAVILFERDLGGTNAWGQHTRIEATVASDQLGRSSVLKGDTLVVGARGHAIVYERDLGGPDNWGRVVTLDPDLAASSFAVSLALDGDTLVVGDDELNVGAGEGAAYVYERDAGGPGNWGEVALLVASNGTALDHFGRSVTIDADTLVVGASNAFNQQGRAYVYERDAGGPGNWGEVADFVAPGASLQANFGVSVSLDGGTLVVGASRDNAAGTVSGAAYVFERDLGGPGEWGFLKQFNPEGLGPGDFFGHSVATDGTTIVVGSITDDDAAPDAGAVYVFAENPITAYCTAGTTTNGCQALMSATGAASVSQASGFDVVISGVEGQKQGLVYFGTNGPKATPWGAGTSYRCVNGPHTRTSSQSSGGAVGQCDGAFALDFNAWMQAHVNNAPGPGQEVWMQTWFRDPQAPLTTSFSDALTFTVCP